MENRRQVSHSSLVGQTVSQYRLTGGGAVDANSRLRFARETQLLATAPEKIAMRCAHLLLSGRTEAACNGEILAITAAKSIFLL